MNDSKGKVVLVGGGCGRDLITTAGLKAVKKADAIVYDALVDGNILSDAKDGCEIIFAGKRAGADHMSQSDIEELLYRLALEGKMVVRLKGGDGFVFGRGGEEALYLGRKGIVCETIPGVSSSIAVPEYFGIPVTHRGISSSFCVVTARREAPCDIRQEGRDRAVSAEDMGCLAAYRGTLVFMMAGASVRDIAGELIEKGMSKERPAAILSCAYMPDAERIDGTLEFFSTYDKKVKNPAMFIVGETAKLRVIPELPVPKILITGTEKFTNRISDAFAPYPVYVKRLVTLKVMPKPNCIPTEFSHYQWIAFTSGNCVRIFFEQLLNNKTDLRSLFHIRFACIGPGSAEALLSYGFHADLIPDEYTSKALACSLLEECGRDRILVLRSEKGSNELGTILTDGGADYEECRIYSTEQVPFSEDAPDFEYVVLGSGEGVRAYFDGGAGSDAGEKTGTDGHHAGTNNKTVYVAMGESCHAVLKEYTDAAVLVPQRSSADGIAEAVMNHINKF